MLSLWSKEGKVVALLTKTPPHLMMRKINKICGGGKRLYPRVTTTAVAAM
jgi:hypothetical protein